MDHENLTILEYEALSRVILQFDLASQLPNPVDLLEFEQLSGSSGKECMLVLLVHRSSVLDWFEAFEPSDFDLRNSVVRGDICEQ